MKIRIFLGILLLFITTCDRQLVGPLRDNPFDAENEITSGDPFYLQTQNLSGHILVSWEYTYEKPVIERFLLYRVNESGLDTLYTGLATTFKDSDVKWDSTYSYYVTGVINEKETSHPEIADIPEVVRRIVVGEDEDYNSIQGAINAIYGGKLYVREGTYQKISITNKNISLKCLSEDYKCIINANDNGSAVAINIVQNNQIELSGFKLTGGNAVNGGGININIDNSNILIDSCLIQDNEVDINGGGIHITGSQSNIVISNTDIENNTAAKSGGGIYIIGDAPEALWVEPISVTINNVKIRDNSADLIEGNGGGIFTQNSANHITRCMISGNESKDGGGMYFDMATYVNISFCSIKENFARLNGGAITAKRTEIPDILMGMDTLIIMDSEIIENNARNGGALYIRKNNNVRLHNNLVVFNNNNYTGDYYGGGLYIKNCNDIGIDYNTIYGNGRNQFDPDEVSRGGSIFLDDSGMNINNSIFWNNNAYSEQEWFNLESSINVSFTIISPSYNMYCEEGCINNKPIFKDISGDDYDFDLVPDSPGVGASDEGNNLGYTRQ